MNPLLAQALELGPVAHGLQDPEGGEIRVREGSGWTRYEVVAPAADPPIEVAIRSEGTTERPADLPDELPHLPRASWVAVWDDDGLTVTWPAPAGAAGTGGAVPGLGGLGAVTGGFGGGSPADPVEDARRRFEREGGGGGLEGVLSAGLDHLEERLRAEGWEVVHREELQPPVPGRVLRLQRNDGVRTFTLSTALGVTTLLLREPGADPPR